MTSRMSASLAKEVTTLEVELGLTTGFFNLLLNEDDWSFVIKLQALVDAALSFSIVNQLGKPELGDVFANLQTGGRVGKLEFIKRLGLLEKEQVQFLRELSDLRNTIAHRIHHVNFSFSSHIRRLEKNQWNTFVNAFAYARLEGSETGAERENIEARVREFPKETIWEGALFCLVVIYLNKEVVTSQRDTQERRAELFDRVYISPNGDNKPHDE